MKLLQLFLLSFFVCVIKTNAQYATIKGTIENIKTDSLKFEARSIGVNEASVSKKIAVHNNSFSTHLAISMPANFYITDGTNYIGGLIDQGDSIIITYDKDNIGNTLKFAGKGSEKVAFSYRLHQLKPHKVIPKKVPDAIASGYPFDYLLNYVDSIGNTLFSELNSIKHVTSIQSYNLLVADIKALLLYNKYKSITQVYGESANETLEKRKNQLTGSSLQYLTNVLHFDSTLFMSNSYTAQVFNIIQSEYWQLTFRKKLDNGVISRYNYVKSHLPSSLQKVVIAQFIENDIFNLNKIDNIEELEKIIRNTYPLPSDSLTKKKLESKLAKTRHFKNGMKAPSFELENEKGETVSLSSFKGKVVLLDFWYAACGPCHIFFDKVKPLKKQYEKNNDIVFLYVSTDMKETWLSALKKYDIPGHHLYTRNLGSEHPIIQSYKVDGYPKVFLIDGNGNFFSTNLPTVDTEELQKEIQKALNVKSNTF